MGLRNDSPLQSRKSFLFHLLLSDFPVSLLYRHTGRTRPGIDPPALNTRNCDSLPIRLLVECCSCMHLIRRVFCKHEVPKGRCGAPTTGKPAIAVRYYEPHLPSHHRGAKGENPRTRTPVTYEVEKRFATLNPGSHSSSASFPPIFLCPSYIATQGGHDR